MATKGYDVFLLEPGTADQVSCKVCGTACGVARNVTGATSFAESLGKIAHVHDRFTCPLSETSWHVQALKLLEAIETSPSPPVQEQMRLDLAELLSARAMGHTVH